MSSIRIPFIVMIVVALAAHTIILRFLLPAALA